MQKKLLTFSFFTALALIAYILLVSVLMRYGNELFGTRPSIFGIISFILLFVVSAAISGTFVLGKPILLYLEGKKQEALQLFIFTVGWLVLFLVVLLATSALYP